MRPERVLAIAVAIFAAGCGQGNDTGDDDAGASCPTCDADGDGVPDSDDQCADTPTGEPVNQVGCADSQLSATLQPTFPPYGLDWTSSGELGRAGGLTWSYAGIQRGDLFHIYWIPCDDPDMPCGLSLDGPIEAPDEIWQYSSTESDLPAGVLAFTNTTAVALEDGTTRELRGRVTVTIVDANDEVIPFTGVAWINLTSRTGGYAAEIPGTGFRVVVLGEVQDTITSTWTPYLDYYDAAPTPTVGGEDVVYVSFSGFFYDK